QGGNADKHEAVVGLDLERVHRAVHVAAEAFSGFGKYLREHALHRAGAELDYGTRFKCGRHAVPASVILPLPESSLRSSLFLEPSIPEKSISYPCRQDQLPIRPRIV